MPEDLVLAAKCGDDQVFLGTKVLVNRHAGDAGFRNGQRAEFVELYSQFEAACEEEGGADLGAHVNVAVRKAYCFTKGPDAEAIRRAHEKLGFPFDSITEVRRVTGVDLRPGLSKGK